MADGDLTEQEWRRVAPLLPRNYEKPGHPWASHRRVINGIRWVLRSGARWRDIPRRRYGPWPGALWAHATTASRAGSATAPGTASSRPCRARRTPPARWTGR